MRIPPADLAVNNSWGEDARKRLRACVMLCSAMTLLLNLIGLAVGVGILVKSADWFTDAAVEVARKLRIPEIIVGATIVSLATTLPEFAVSFTAALRGQVDMAVGNAVGSTICNVGLILGLCAFIAPMAVTRAGFLPSAVGLLVIAGLFGALGYVFPGGSRWTGIVMLACLVAYLGATLRSSLAHRAATADDAGCTEQGLSNGRIAILFMLGAVGVVGGSRLMVYTGQNLALAMGISELVIALTIMAIGTSTPELVVSLTSIVKKRRGLSIGNIIGANILNLAWVIGACSVVADLPLQRLTLYFDIPVMMILSVLLLIFGLTGHRLSRWEGAVFFAIYALYLILRFTVLQTPAVGSSVF